MVRGPGPGGEELDAHSSHPARSLTVTVGAAGPAPPEHGVCVVDVPAAVNILGKHIKINYP